MFSRPQPQSRGKKPGGRRQLRSTPARDARKKTKRHRNPGTRRQTTNPTGIPVPERSSDHHGTSSGGSAGVRGLFSLASSAQQPGGQEVKGVLIGAPGNADAQNALEPGAPGLRGAGAGGTQTPWLAIGIAGALLLSVLIGTQIERRRPQVIL